MKHKKIFCILIGIIFVCVTFSAIDFARLQGNQMPIFMVQLGSTKDKKATYYGLGYKLERQLKNSPKEELIHDEEVRFGFLFYTWKVNITKPKEKKIEYSYTVKTQVKENCKNQIQLYTEDQTRKYYTVCLDEINYETKDATYTLKEAIFEKKFTLAGIIHNLKEYSLYKDGGSKMYKDDGTTGFTNLGLSVLVCSTLEGVEDYYIGPKDMRYEDEFCKVNSSEQCAFTKTYHILHKIETEEGDFYVTLKLFQGEVESVLLPKEIAEELKEDEVYEFSFQRIGETIPDKMEELFESSLLEKVEKTDKVGMDQVQDEVCQQNLRKE